MFLSVCLKKTDFSVEKQGGDMAGLVHSCIISETVKHAGEGASRD